MNGVCFGFVLADVALHKLVVTDPPVLDMPNIQVPIDYVSHIKSFTNPIVVKVSIPEILPLEAGGKVIEKTIKPKSNFFKNKNAPIPSSTIKTGNYFSIKIIPTLNLLDMPKIAKGSKLLVYMPTNDPKDFYGMVIS